MHVASLLEKYGEGSTTSGLYIVVHDTQVPGIGRQRCISDEKGACGLASRLQMLSRSFMQLSYYILQKQSTTNQAILT